MVIRGFGICQTCDAHHTLRAGVGIETNQEHFFDCSECGSSITVAVKTAAPNAWFVSVDNFTLKGESPENSHIVNLHPNFAFKLNQLHSERVFVSLEQISKIIPNIRSTTGKYINDVAATFDIPNSKNIWSIVKRALILEKKPDSEIKINRLIENFLRQRCKYRPETVASSPNDMLVSFFTDLFYPKIINILEPASNLIRWIIQKNVYVLKITLILRLSLNVQKHT